MPTSPTSNINLNLSFEEKMEVDARSVYIGNVDYAATAEELEQHFHGCGSINRCFFTSSLSCFGFRTQPHNMDP
jgi:polyadenylate-binding protein 2